MGYRQIQDMIWSIQQAPLIRGGEVWPAESWFRQLPLPADMRIDPPPPRFRLGIHFEKLFQSWLDRIDEYQLLAANLQVQGAQRTLGEFDLLVDTPNGQEHWELAIKFYINVSNPGDQSRWFGPDPSDTLASKFDRLTQHQLKLIETPEAQMLLKQRGLNIKNTRCIMKGRLYHPWENFHQQNVETPGNVNPGHLKGWWIALDDIGRLEPFRIAYLDKQYWLSPVTHLDDPLMLEAESLPDFLHSNRQIAPQVGLLDEDGDEISRGFVLKPEWFEQLPD